MRELTETEIPDYEFENIARCILPVMQEYFASEQGKAAFEKWMDEQNRDCSSSDKNGNAA